jgi:hypothetical protein
MRAANSPGNNKPPLPPLPSWWWVVGLLALFLVNSWILSAGFLRLGIAGAFLGFCVAAWLASQIVIR